MFCTPRASPRSVLELCDIGGMSGPKASSSSEALQKSFLTDLVLIFLLLLILEDTVAGGALCALALLHFVLWLVALQRLKTTLHFVLCFLVCTVVAGVVSLLVV